MSTSTQYHIYVSIRSHFMFLCPETESTFTYEYHGADRACSVTNGKGGSFGQPDDHHALLLSALAWRGVPRYNYTIFKIN